MEADYATQRSGLLDAGNRQKTSAQNVYSFSGFGRSSAAANKMADIQSSTDQAVENARLAMEAEITRKQMELAGADSDALK
jgi:hypothetical protein